MASRWARSELADMEISVSDMVPDRAVNLTFVYFLLASRLAIIAAAITMNLPILVARVAEEAEDEDHQM